MNGYLYDYKTTSHSFAYSLIIVSNDKYVLHFQYVCVFISAHPGINIVLIYTLCLKILCVDAVLVLDVKL